MGHERILLPLYSESKAKERSAQSGRTTLTVKILYAPQEARDGVLKSGMSRRAGASCDKLAEILENS
jgi:hypothetical protein